MKKQPLQKILILALFFLNISPSFAQDILNRDEIEKYLKAIVLYHDGNTKTINHNLIKAVELIEKIPNIDWSFIDPLKEYFTYLTDYGSNRYFIKPSGTYGTELLALDQSVWIVRRYCQDFQLIELDPKNNFDFAEYLAYLSSDELRRNHIHSAFFMLVIWNRFLKLKRNLSYVAN